MARGWESKAVESQREDGRERRRRGDRPSPEEREMMSRQESLELSRRRVLHDLETARSEVQRTALQHALDHLERELANLSSRG